MVNAKNVLILIALVCFILAAFGLPALGTVALIPLGLAFWVGSSLVG